VREAHGLAYSVTGGESMSLQEVRETPGLAAALYPRLRPHLPDPFLMRQVRSVGERLAAAAHPDAQIIFGAAIDPSLGDEVVVTLVATGFVPPPEQVQRPISSYDLFAFREPVRAGSYEEYLELYESYVAERTAVARGGGVAPSELNAEERWAWGQANRRQGHSA